MPDVRCFVDSCTYYNDDFCSAGRISVDGVLASSSDATRCNTFFKGSPTNATHYDPTLHMMVQCDAVKCKYNSGHMCQAASIQISGENACNDSEDTLCASFEEV